MSDYTKEKKELVEKHIHFWGPAYDLVSKKCDCGAVGISEAEYQRRIEEWKSYAELVKTTPAYLDWQQMREAFKTHNLKAIREIQQRVAKRVTQNPDAMTEKERWVEHYEYLDKPDFPDPESWSKYVIL